MSTPTQPRRWVNWYISPQFLGQYGGMNQGAERYKELLTLPEAELVKGVSIDDYSTYRATRFSEPV